MTEYISGFYPTALDAGISPLDFWDFTILEVADLIASRNRTYTMERKEQAIQQYKLAQMVASYVSHIFSNDESKNLELWDFYPDIFEEERKQVEQARIANQLLIHKERMRAFAERNKGKFKGIE